LCFFRKWLNKVAVELSILICFCICVTCFLLTEIGAQYALGIFPQYGLDNDRLIRFGVVAIIVSFVILRSFSLVSIVEQRNVAEIEMTMQALQARIKPHFLFNCLNTISELAHRDAQEAEEAIGSLALLFRAGLESEEKFHSLENELNLCRRYVGLEHWRLADRLLIDWNIDVEDASRWKVPKLILQPLIENSILHGVLADGSIKIKVDVRETKQDLSLMIENHTDLSTEAVGGHGIAVDNIKERLFVLYDDRQIFRTKQYDDRYTVIMRFPKRGSSYSKGR
jgi:two-component system sensor histidine kinase AlgZ